MQSDVPLNSPILPVDPEKVLPPTPPLHPVMPISMVDQSQSNINYAQISTRFFASCVDGVFLGLFSFVFTTMGTFFAPTKIVKIILQVIIYAVQILYPIYFIGSKGQTPGKMIMKIKVVKADSGEIPGFVSAFLREFIGKMVSGLVFGLGYFAAFKDPKKQSWHDKIAGTVVVKI